MQRSDDVIPLQHALPVPEDTGPAVFSKAALYAHKYLNTPACVCACNAYMHALTCAHKYTLTKSHSYSCNQTHELCVQNFWHLPFVRPPHFREKAFTSFAVFARTNCQVVQVYLATDI